MEKRLFLAIGLSLVVVWLWSAVSPHPQKRPAANKSSQLIDTKEVKENPNENQAIAPTPTVASAEINIEKRIETLDSEKLEVNFSNIGATIEKVVIRKFGDSLPLVSMMEIAGYENAPFVLDQSNDNKVVYSYENAEIKITRQYALDSDEHVIRSLTKFYNKSLTSKLIDYISGGYTIEMSSLNKQKMNPSMRRSKSLLEYAVYAGGDIFRKASAYKFSPKETKTEFGEIKWTGFRDRYYCALLSPQYETKGYSIETINDEKLKLSANTDKISLSPGQSEEFASVIYIGPEELGDLKQFKLGFEKIKRYYRFGLFDGVSKIIESMMEAIHKVIPNWGATIIAISIIIYFSMYPLTLKGMRSMKKMQSLQPMIAKLKEKHKDNPQKMNKEMMELYRENKVNPVGGCLPMLLQMPVFIGLYQVLWRSVSFKGAHFLWIKDLSQPDRLFIMPFKLPVLGNEFNLLPIIMIGVMFVQQRMSAKNMVITDPQQQAQQKIMATILPFFLGFIFYKFASGLTLYFTMFYTFSTFTQWKMSNVKKGA